MTDDSGPAFPRPFSPPGSYSDDRQSVQWFPNEALDGMSLRDWYAGMAPAEDIELMTLARKHELRAIAEEQEALTYIEPSYTALIAEARFQWADAMLAERKRSN